MWKLKIVRIQISYPGGFHTGMEFEFKNEDDWELFLVTEDPSSHELLVHFKKKIG